MTKRGIEDSLTQSSAYTIGSVNGSSPQTMNGSSNNNSNTDVPMMDSSVAAAEAYAQMLDPMSGSKKMKLLTGESINTIGGSTSTSPNSSNSSNSGKSGSRVVHLRNVPQDTTYADLASLAGGFGCITQHLLCKSKGQAFVEFESPVSAAQMAAYWAQSSVGGVANHLQPSIRGRHVHCQLSNHMELKPNFLPKEEGEEGYERNGERGERGANHTATTSTPSPVIRVVVENMIYSITLDSLHSIFSRSGKVQKIVTFTKNGIFQALVQYADITQAIQAKLSLDGAPMFSGGANTLRVEYSKLQNLIVKYNNEKSRDYTNTTLGSGGDRGGATYANESGRGGSSALGGGSSSFGSSYGSRNGSQFGSQYGALGGGSIQQALMTNAALSGLVSPFANQVGGASLGGLVLSPVIHVSGLSPEHSTPDALFTLFGVYGDVLRVKILFNKKDTALIQLAEPNQAHLAISNLDRTRLNGKTLRVSTSKHQMVQMPKDGHQDSGLTKDYTNSPLHRFKRPGSKNYNNIYPPSETLHVSNIPATVSEDELQDAFVQETGKEIAKFKFFPNDRRMALVQFHCVEDSILALIKMHNYKVAEHSHLRVSFSKSPV